MEPSADALRAYFQRIGRKGGLKAAGAGIKSLTAEQRSRAARKAWETKRRRASEGKKGS